MAPVHVHGNALGNLFLGIKHWHDLRVKPSAHSFGQFFGLLRACDNDVVVTALVAHIIVRGAFFRDAAFENFRGGLDGLVAFSQPVVVVEDLEAVNINVEQDEFLALENAFL